MNKLERDRKFYEKLCEDFSLELSDIADKIIEKVNQKGGLCPCRLKPTPCPCPMLEKDIQEKGRCTCNLFVLKKEETSE